MKHYKCLPSRKHRALSLISIGLITALLCGCTKTTSAPSVEPALTETAPSETAPTETEPTETEPTETEPSKTETNETTPNESESEEKALDKTAPLPDGIYKIRNKASGRVLNMQMCGMVDGSTVQQYADTDNMEVLWRVTKSGNYYSIQSLLTPRNMAVRKDSIKIGANIEVRTPDQNENLGELWMLEPKDDAFQIISAKSELTMGLTEESTKTTLLPELLEFENVDWQLWQFEEVKLNDNLPSLLPLEGALFHSSCPEIVKYNDVYYMYIMAPHISIKSSKDLINWTSIGTVFPGGDPSWLSREVPGYGIWAPGVYPINGKYYLYYCISTVGSQNSAIGVAENITLDPASPDYKWVDKGMVIRSYAGDDYNCIDPNIITDENGDIWLTYGSYWNGIYQRQINTDTGLLLEENAESFHIAKRNARNGAIEAPYIIKRDDYYYLFVAFNPMDNSYQNRVGRGTSVHGPFYDRDGKEMLEGGGTEVTQGLSDLLMPGHASVFIDDDGKYYLVSEYFRKDSPSIMLIGDLLWDEEGWPITSLTPNITTLLSQ